MEIITNYFNIKKQLTDDELFCSLQVTASNVPDDLEPTCLFVFPTPKNPILERIKRFSPSLEYVSSSNE